MKITNVAPQPEHSESADTARPATTPAPPILNLNDVTELDPINVGHLAACCILGDDHHTASFHLALKDPQL